MYKDELLLKNVFAQIFSFVPFNHYGHRSSNSIGCGYAINQKQTKAKILGPLIAHNEKLKEDLSRGNSISFVLFLFFVSLVFGFPKILFVCLFQKIGMFPLSFTSV